jgi:hypothetical protein
MGFVVSAGGLGTCSCFEPRWPLPVRFSSPLRSGGLELGDRGPAAKPRAVPARRGREYRETPGGSSLFRQDSPRGSLRFQRREVAGRGPPTEPRNNNDTYRICKRTHGFASRVSGASGADVEEVARNSGRGASRQWSAPERAGPPAQGRAEATSFETFPVAPGISVGRVTTGGADPTAPLGSSPDSAGRKRKPSTIAGRQQEHQPDPDVARGVWRFFTLRESLAGGVQGGAPKGLDTRPPYRPAAQRLFGSSTPLQRFVPH